MLEVVISILSYRSSSWTNTSAHTRALRHSLLGAMPLLAALASPDPADPSGEPLLSAEPELFTVAARLIFRVTSAFSWAEVTEAFNPAVPCPLRLVSLQSLGPRAMPGLHGGVAAAYDAGVQVCPLNSSCYNENVYVSLLVCFQLKIFPFIAYNSRIPLFLFSLSTITLRRLPARQCRCAP